MRRAAHQHREVTAFGQQHQDQGYFLWVGFQPIERGVQPTGGFHPARLAFPILNVPPLAAFAITHHRMQPLIGHRKIEAMLVGTSMSARIAGFLAPTRTFDLRIGRDCRAWAKNLHADPGTTRSTIMGRPGA